MKKSDFQLIGYMGIGIGVLLLVAGGLEYSSLSSFYYYVTPEAINSTVAPLLIAGVVCFVLGGGFLSPRLT